MQPAGPAELGPLVLADRGIIRSESPNELYLFGVDLLVRRGVRLPQELPPNREVTALRTCEVGLDETAVRASEVVDAVGEVFADVHLAVRIRDLVDDLHERDLPRIDARSSYNNQYAACITP